MCQKYLAKINKGDKRVFLINGKVCGAISRVPKKGSFLSNMSKGAIPINIKLTKVENAISKLIAKDLKKENIHFAGIDFIDQKLNGDINVTSPTGLKTLYDLSTCCKCVWAPKPTDWHQIGQTNKDPSSNKTNTPSLPCQTCQPCQQGWG